MSEGSVSEWELRADYADTILSWAQRDHKLGGGECKLRWYKIDRMSLGLRYENGVLAGSKTRDMY